MSNSTVSAPGDMIPDSFDLADTFPLSPKPRYGDRFMPTRVGNHWDRTYLYNLEQLESVDRDKYDKTPPVLGSKKRRRGDSEDTVYTRLLKNEVLGYEISDMKETEHLQRDVLTPSKGLNRRLFHYDSSQRSGKNIECTSPYSTSPISENSKTLMESPKRHFKKICQEPYKILDAPELEDDFYLNLLDWSIQGFLGVGLNQSVYLLKMATQKEEAFKLLSYESIGRKVTSVVWNNTGDLIGIGSSKGTVEVWDIATQKRLSQRYDHSDRVSSLSWHGDVLFSGSKDRSICVKDIRDSSASPNHRLINHSQEVCGLKWSGLNGLLASGGNDNRLNIWDYRNTCGKPLFAFDEHKAAIKGIDWNPNEHGILATGGGTADRKVKIWNTHLGTCTKSVDTGSQICNLTWSKHSSEFVTTHGYVQSQILIWNYPAIRPSNIIQEKAHKSRVLFLAASPDGEDIITGAGPPCETLRLWKVFPSGKLQKHLKSSVKLFNMR